MPDQRGDVNSQPPVQGIEVLRDRLPRPPDSCPDGLQRDRLNMGEDARQHLPVFFMCRSERQGTVADHDGGGSVIARERTKGIPGDLGIVMCVVIDDPRSDDQAIGIQDASRVAVHLSDVRDTTAADGNVAVEAGYAGTVNNLSVSDDQVVWHCSSYPRASTLRLRGRIAPVRFPTSYFLPMKNAAFFQRPRACPSDP